MAIEIRGGLILAMFKYTYDGEANDEVCLDENLDKDLFEPDGITIAYVLSNFCKKYHPNYKNLSKEYIEENKKRRKAYNNNRGRKPKDKTKKNKKKNNGSNEEFGSCITFGVISGNRVHGIKMFRKRSGNISKLNHLDVRSKTYIPELLGKLFDYINSIKPIGIRYLSFNVELENITSSYDLPEGKVINLYKFREKLNLGLYNNDYWDCFNVIYNFNGKVNHLKIILLEFDYSTRTTDIKLTPEGKVHVYGSKDSDKSEVYLRKLFGIIDKHKDDYCIIIDGVRAAPKPKDRPDYTQELEY